MHHTVITRKLDALNGLRVLSSTPINGWSVRLAEYMAPGQYHELGDWRPLEANDPFPALSTVRLRAEVAVPAAAHETGQVRLAFGHSELEGLIRLNDRPFAGLDRNHTLIPAPLPGTYTLEIEAAAVLGAYCRPGRRSEHARFTGASVQEIDTVIEGLWYDLCFLWETVQAVDEPRRKGRLDAALEDALLAIDLHVGPEQLRRDAAAVRAQLARDLAGIAPDPEAGSVFLAGHTHIDTAWLWPIKETIRKCSRTFATACRLMEQFPQFHFSCSQAQLYAYVKQYEPALYEDIRKWVEEGRWHTTGAMWVESDCNVTSGESLIRQVLYGKRFFREEFGTDPRTCWLPDVFGYPGNMPQILRGSEVDYFMTCKLHWQSTNPFPHHLFWWEGVDGTRILTHIPRLRNYYNGKPEPEQLRFAWDNFREKSVADEVLLPFGYGDGGGGVTPEMLEYLPRAEAMPGLPATRTGGEEEFFDDALAKAADLPVWSGELYLETHRGTYTTQSATKQANRQCEYALRTAELWTSVAAMSGIAADAAPLDEAWRRVLLQQFHDILPGSSIAEVYEDALLDYHRAREAAEVCAAVALESMVRDLGIQGDVVVFNSRGWDRTDPVELLLPTTDSAPAALVGPDGEPLPLQILETGADGHRALVEPRVPVPAMGYAGYRVADTAAPLAENELQAWNRGLESGLFRLEIDENGAVTRLLDKRCGREVIPPGERANDWQFFQDGPAQEAAWNVYATYEKRRYDDPAPARIEVVEQGPVRAALRVTRRFRSSAYTLDIRLYANTPRIDFCAKIDWQERDTMLKVAFPVSVRSAHSTSEIQFGAIERPTHRNTSWEEQKFEIAAQSWVDLSEAGYGVSLMNRERYGHDVHGNRLRLTLLRSADYPDPEADRGSHTFTYSLLPHQGDWTEAQAPWRAAELNDPMRTAPGQGASEDADPRRSFLAFDGLPVVVSALKPASDGNGWILRIYEPHGGRGMTRITVPETIGSVVPCSHVETVRGAALPLHDATVAVAMEPFEIRTFRLA